MQKEKEATEKPSILVQNIVVRPASRKVQDIGTWRNALRAAEATNPRRTELYDLYDDILLDGHLDSIIEKRIMAVTNADWQFVRDGKVIEGVNNLIDTLAFEDVLKLIMDSRFWGYSVGELLFAKDGTFSVCDVPKKHMRPHLGVVAFEQTGDTGINIREGIYLNTVLEVGKPRDLGKLLKAAQYVIYKRGDFGDWSQFVEIFGMPFRQGTYDGYDENQRVKLEEALEKMGGNGYAVIPAGSSIDLKENKTNADGKLFDLLKDACNQEMSKIILGQTMTTEDGSSRSQSETHKDVEEAINKADLIFVRRILNTRFLKILEANGIKTDGGYFQINGLGEEQLPKKERAEIYIKMKNEGKLPIDDDFLYEDLGIPKPANYDELKEESRKAAEALVAGAAQKTEEKPGKEDKEKKEDVKLAEETGRIQQLVVALKSFFE